MPQEPQNEYLTSLLGGKQPADTTASTDSGDNDLPGLLRGAGFSEDLIPTMTAIGQAESSGRSNALNSTPKEHSVGLWQINLKAHPEYSEEQMRDPQQNARAALDVYQKQGLKAWGAYTDGRYKKYVGKNYQHPSGAAPQPANEYLQSLLGQSGGQTKSAEPQGDAAPIGEAPYPLDESIAPEAPVANLELDKTALHPEATGKNIKLPKSVTAPGVPLTTSSDTEGQDSSSGGVVRVPVKQGMKPEDVLHAGLILKAKQHGLDDKSAKGYADDALSQMAQPGLNTGSGEAPVAQGDLENLYKHGYADLNIVDPAYDKLLAKHGEQFNAQEADKELKDRAGAAGRPT
jgi:hypothetical protein